MDKFDKLFHLRKDRKNRLIPLVSVLDDDGDFHVWINRGNEISSMKSNSLIKGAYFSKKADEEGDVCFNFLNFFYQRNVIKSIFPFLDYITNDMHNLATSLWKLEIFHEVSSKENDTSRCASSELEYILIVCRSIYDYVQFIAQTAWDNIELVNKNMHKKSLRGSFAKMVLRGDELISCEEIQAKYGITLELAKFYSEEGVFFKKLKNLRDDIVHRGLTADYIFDTEEGFAVSTYSKMFSSFDIWAEAKCCSNENLTLLSPIISHIIQKTLEMVSYFTDALACKIMFPDDIAPGYRLFIRDKNMYRLIELGLRANVVA